MYEKFITAPKPCAPIPVSCTLRHEPDSGIRNHDTGCSQVLTVLQKCSNRSPSLITRMSIFGNLFGQGLARATKLTTDAYGGGRMTPAFTPADAGYDFGKAFVEPMTPDQKEAQKTAIVIAEENKKRMLEEEEKKRLEAKARQEALARQKQQEDAIDQPFKEQMQGQKVALLQQAGQGLEAQKAMQNPDYQLGSGSALRQRRGEIAPEWARMNRAARRLERKGYRDQAGQMFAAAEIERVNSPSMVSQDQRNRMQFMDMELDAKNFEAKKTQNLYDQYMKRKQQREMARFDSMPI